MNRLFCVALVGVVSLGMQSFALGQNSRGLVDTAEANRYGLKRMWFTQVEVDGARSRVTNLTQHVSSTEFTTVFEVVHPEGKYSYRETDLDKHGRVIGKDQAKKLAEVKLKDMQALKVDAKAAVQLVPRITLYAVTDVGLIQAIDSETGRTRWKTAIGTSKYPTEAVGANDQYVGAINGSELFILDAAKGEVLWQRKTVRAPGAGPALSKNLAFVPMIDGAMEAYNLEDPDATPAIFRSHGRAMVQPLYTGSYVAWPTDRGHMYVTGATNNHIAFRLETNGDIVNPATFLPPNKIVISSIDGFIYCVHQVVGTLQWRFSTGEPIVTTPVPYDDTVYCVTEDGSLFAIDGEEGQERWSTNHMRQVVGASRDRLYCLNDTGRLLLLDRRTGTRIGSLSTELDDLPYVNKETDRIIVGTTEGLLQCFREGQQEYPLVHVILSKPEPVAPRKPVRTQATETPKPAATDPFGAPIEASPSSAEPAAKVPLNAPAGKPAANDDDPFNG
jgi:outer membrane protein assembly factor BamB